MRRLSATVLTLLLGVHPLLAQGPITRSMSNEASRLAVAPELTEEERPGWRVVRRLDPITPLVVATPDQTAAWTFVAADDAWMTVLDLETPGLAADVKRQLMAIAKANPQALADAAHGGPKAIDWFRFGDNGVFLRNTRIATRAELIRRIPVGDVFTVSIAARRHGSVGAVAATAFVVAGTAVAAPFLAYALAGDNSGAAGTAAYWVFGLGLPFAAGYGTWRATSRVTEEVIYRRRPTAPSGTHANTELLPRLFSHLLTEARS